MQKKNSRKTKTLVANSAFFTVITLLYNFEEADPRKLLLTYLPR